VLHACYRNNRLASAAVASQIAIHRALGTWKNRVSTYIALTEFAKQKFIEGGLPAEKLTVKPNFLSNDPGEGKGAGDYMLFVGRLSDEKGPLALARAWAQLRRPTRLKIAGDGPLMNKLRDLAAVTPQIEILGSRSRSDVIRLIQDARALILPSKCYEGLPMTIVESFACGTPVICSDLPSLVGIVQNGSSGAHFKTGSPESLAACVDGFPRTVEELRPLRVNARASYLQHFTADRNYLQLLSIYRKAVLETASQRS
jgi:glycosyltransferase involved in cell wall biosynthesis